MSVDPANPAILPTSVPPTTPVESDLDPDAMDDEDIEENQALEEKLIQEQQDQARPADWDAPPASPGAPSQTRPEDWNEPPATATPDAHQPTPLSDDRR
jgi:hypothetical protein